MAYSVNKLTEKLRALSKTKYFYFVAVFLTVFVLFFVFKTDSVQAQAKEVLSVSGSILSGLFGIVVTILGYIIYFILYCLEYFIVFLFGILVSFAQYNDFVNSEAVIKGWIIVRDLANMAVLIFLLIIAFGILLRIENYGNLKSLSRLLIAAVLINFSKTICGILIDVSQLVMLTFVNGFASVAGLGLVKALNLDKFMFFNGEQGGFFGNVASGATAGFSVVFQVLAGILMALFFVMTILAVVCVIIATLAWRIINLWMLVILAPIAFLLRSAPFGSKYYSQWFGKFSNFLINGPFLAFFLWLSLAIMINLSASSSQTIATAGAGLQTATGGVTQAAGSTIGGAAVAALTAENTITMILAIGLLVGSLVMSQEFGAVGASRAKSMLGTYYKKSLKYIGKGVDKTLKGAGYLALGRDISPTALYGRTKEWVSRQQAKGERRMETMKETLVKKGGVARMRLQSKKEAAAKEAGQALEEAKKNEAFYAKAGAELGSAGQALQKQKQLEHIQQWQQRQADLIKKQKAGTLTDPKEIEELGNIQNEILPSLQTKYKLTNDDIASEAIGNNIKAQKEAVQKIKNTFKTEEDKKKFQDILDAGERTAGVDYGNIAESIQKEGGNTKSRVAQAQQKYTAAGKAARAYRKSYEYRETQKNLAAIKAAEDKKLNEEFSDLDDVQEFASEIMDAIEKEDVRKSNYLIRQANKQGLLRKVMEILPEGGGDNEYGGGAAELSNFKILLNKSNQKDVGNEDINSEMLQILEEVSKKALTDGNTGLAYMHDRNVLTNEVAWNEGDRQPKRDAKIKDDVKKGVIKYSDLPKVLIGKDNKLNNIGLDRFQDGDAVHMFTAQLARGAEGSDVLAEAIRNSIEEFEKRKKTLIEEGKGNEALAIVELLEAVQQHRGSDNMESLSQKRSLLYKEMGAQERLQAMAATKNDDDQVKALQETIDSLKRRIDFITEIIDKSTQNKGTPASSTPTGGQAVGTPNLHELESKTTEIDAQLSQLSQQIDEKIAETGTNSALGGSPAAIKLLQSLQAKQTKLKADRQVIETEIQTLQVSLAQAISAAEQQATQPAGTASRTPEELAADRQKMDEITAKVAANVKLTSEEEELYRKLSQS